MKKNLPIILIYLTSIGLSDYYSDRFLIYIDNSISLFEINENTGRTNLEDLNQKMDDMGASGIHQWLSYARSTDRDGDTYLNRYYVIQFNSPRTDIQALVKNVESLQSIRTSEIMTINRPSYIPNDPRWNQQWYLPNIEADLAYDLWDIDGGQIPGQIEGGEIIVGIVDDASDWDHPDLINNIWQNLGEDADGDGVVLVQNGSSWSFDPDDINNVDDDGDGYIDNFIGWDMADDDNNPIYPSSNLSHGTSVAGCVSGATNNGTGIASVGWSVKLMPFRCSNDGQYIEYGYNGILAAAQMGANVINCSWGGFGGGNQSVINSAYNNYGCIIVASAGNGDENGNTNFDYHAPSGLNNVLSVTATGSGDNFNCWATAGTTVDLCAPGENITTTSLGGGYGAAWGTSFSSPITAGAVALIWSKFPAESQEWVVDRIITTTDEFADMDGSCNAGSLEGMVGSGRLNINKALSAGIFPSLSIIDVNYQNDDDGDGVFNPGEQVKVKIIVANGEGWADAENVVATISTDDDRIAFIDNLIEFDNPIPAGGSSFTLIDHFLVYAFPDAQLGDIPCTVHLVAGTESPFYETDVEIDISLSLNQFGYPITGINIKSSPMIADLDGNSYSEIYFGGEDDKLHGYMIAGMTQYGFPFECGGNVRSSPAGGDVDGDGENEIVFGSHDGNLYILSTTGIQELAYTQAGYIVGAPALFDLDGDEDLEIIFTTQNGSNGKVYAIHHDGNDVDGFPADISEKMLVGAAVGDLEGDGSPDIVVVTWEDHIYAFNADGTTKSGFPFLASNRFNSPATLVDLDDDGDLEIVAGNDDGDLYILHHDGSVMTTFSTGDDIRGGISVADVNDDGSKELLFVGYDDLLHVWNPASGEELEGWPFDLGYNSLSGPITADLDNDGDLEIVAAMKSGTVFVFHHDGSMFNNFPTNFAGNIESTPTVGDLDNDGDFELVFGTTQGLQVIDIKSDAGSRDSWKMHRGNLYRNGLYDITLVSIEPDKDILPGEFFVSQNYPNPFNPTTNVNIQLPEQNNLIVSIYDVSSRLINTLVDEKLDAGFYSIEWNGKDNFGQAVPTGVYFLKVVSGDFTATKKMVYIK
jgi:subtilisin family serine protease